MIPGEVDHIAVYIGAEGKCIEAGATGKVVEFDCYDNWDADRMLSQRGFLDKLYGISYPLKNKHSCQTKERQIRQDVVDYCFRQVGKPYNLNFFDSTTEETFYCSQLAYKAYLRNGINFNMDRGIIDNPLTKNIVFPQEIWENCEHYIV